MTNLRKKEKRYNKNDFRKRELKEQDIIRKTVNCIKRKLVKIINNRLGKSTINSHSTIRA